MKGNSLKCDLVIVLMKEEDMCEVFISPQWIPSSSLHHSQLNKTIILSLVFNHYFSFRLKRFVLAAAVSLNLPASPLIGQPFEGLSGAELWEDFGV